MNRRGFIKNLFKGTAVAGAYAAFPASIGAGFMSVGENNAAEEIEGFKRGDKSFTAVENYTKMYGITPDNALALLQAVQTDQDTVLLAATGGFIAAGTHNVFKKGVPFCDPNTTVLAAPLLSGLNASAASDVVINSREAFKEFPLTQAQTLIDQYGMSAENAENFSMMHRDQLRMIITLSGGGAAFLKERFTKRDFDQTETQPPQDTQPPKTEQEIFTLEA